MSKIELYKNIKLILNNKLNTGNENVIKYIKDYINNKDILPSIEEAVDFILKNYKEPTELITKSTEETNITPATDMGLNILKTIAKKLLKSINSPVSFTIDFSSVQPLPEDENIYLMVTFMKITKNYEDEITKLTLKIANPGLIPDILKITQISGDNCVDVMFECTDIPKAEEYIKNYS